MASRQIRKPAKDDSEIEVEEIFTQRKRPAGARPIFAIGRPTNEEVLHDTGSAQSAALAIKTDYPIVQVSVYDSVENTHAIVEVQAASS
jgi:hypothetical protein